MSSHVEQIKEKLGITDVVGQYITLEKAGSNYKANCPFHHEKTASFFISPTRGTYYCFGCGAKGDIISFVQEFEGLDFMGALRVLAKKAGIELVRENPTKRTERERLYLMLEHATLFFQKNLSVQKEALEYLTKRGLELKSIQEWRLGYAPDAWKGLYTYIHTKGFSAEEMEKVGLVKKSEKIKGDFYDRFRGRIIFPIFDGSGRVVAFSGRIFKDDGTQAKYLNSPETPLFEKSKILYGYDRAKNDIRKSDKSIIVEGQMDLVMSHQIGLTNTVATSGTALTSLQLELIRRLSSHLIIAFDGDKAGNNAALRGFEIALSLDMDVSLAELPEGKDPADLAKEDPETLKSALTSAIHIVDFILIKVIAEKDDRIRVLRIEKEVLPYVARLKSQFEKSHFIAKIANQSRIKEDILWQELKKLERNETQNTYLNREEKVEKTTQTRKNTIEKKIFGILFWQEAQKNNAVHTSTIKEAYTAICGKDAYDRAYQEHLPLKDELTFEAELTYNESNKLENDLTELFLNFKEDYFKEAFLVNMKELEEAERQNDMEKISIILKKCQEVSEQLRKIAEIRGKK